MATINLAIVIPDAQMPRVQAAMRANWGKIPDGVGGFRDMTNAELIEKLRASVMASIKDITLRFEQDTAKANAAVAVTEVSTT